MSAERWAGRRPDAGADFDRRVKTDRLLRVLFEVTFEQENRIRALERRAEITRAQAVAALRAKFVGD